MDLVNSRARRARFITAAAAALLIGGTAVGAEGPVGEPGSSLRTVHPARILDTRTGVGAPVGKIGPGQTITLDVAGLPPVPAHATAVMLNITATAATEATYVSAWPAGSPQPDASILNVSAGEDVANMVTASLGEGGALNLFNSAGEVHLIADVAGYLTSSVATGQPGPTGPQGPSGPQGPGALFADLDGAPGLPDVAVLDGLRVRLTCPTASSAVLAISTASDVPFEATFTLMTDTDSGTLVSNGAGHIDAALTGSSGATVRLTGVAHIPNGPAYAFDAMSVANGCWGHAVVTPLVTVT